jgi:hypothetical protein
MRISTKASGIAGATAIITVGLMGPASAASSISVDVPVQVVANKLTADSHPASAPITVSIPAGQYSVIQGSKDDAHPNQVDQPNERWYAVFYDANGAIIGTTSTTPDLALADVSREWDGEPISITANATTVVYFHSPGKEADSIYPNLLKLTPIVVSPTLPTTTTTTTTIPEVTTAPPTTEPPKVTPEPKPYVPVIVVAADVPVASTAPSTTAATTTTAAPTVVAAPSVQVKGLQIENTVPTTAAPAAVSAAPEIAFTGKPSKSLFVTALGLLGLGSWVMLSLRRKPEDQ